MAKTRVLSVAELEKMLKQVKQEIAELQAERKKLAARLGEIDSRLAQLGAAKRGRPKGKRGRPAQPKAKKAVKKGKKPGRKKMTLAQHVLRILQKAGGPMEVKDIAQALKAKGVSKAKTLATQVGQVLKAIGAKKVGRGRYVWGEA